MSQKDIDKAVLELLVKVEEKKEEIKKLKSRPQWLTNCSFSKNPDITDPVKRVNIQIQSAEVLVDFYAYLLEREEFLTRAAEELGIEADLTHLGCKIADWKADFKTRINQLSIEKKQAELDALDKRVNKLVSAEQRREMELQAIQEMLK